jgi:hypothetical protein
MKIRRLKIWCKYTFNPISHSQATYLRPVIAKGYCIAGNRTWLYHLPQSQIITCSLLSGVLLSCKEKEISSSVPGLSMMTHRECRVGRPFPVMWLDNVWEPAPPPHRTGQSQLFNPRFQGLILRHRIAVTWTCDWLFWFSFITDLITPNITPFCNFKIGAWSKRLSFLIVVLSLAGCLCPTVFQSGLL